MRRVRYAIAAGALAVALTALDAVAQVGGGVLRMSEGATLSTEVDDVFHDIGEQGLTIEGWFYLDRLPEVGEVQTATHVPTLPPCVLQVTGLTPEAEEAQEAAEEAPPPPDPVVLVHPAKARGK